MSFSRREFGALTLGAAAYGLSNLEALAAGMNNSFPTISAQDLERLRGHPRKWDCISESEARLAAKLRGNLGVKAFDARYRNTGASGMASASNQMFPPPAEFSDNELFWQRFDFTGAGSIDPRLMGMLVNRASSFMDGTNFHPRYHGSFDVKGNFEITDRDVRLLEDIIRRMPINGIFQFPKRPIVVAPYYSWHEGPGGFPIEACTNGGDGRFRSPDFTWDYAASLPYPLGPYNSVNPSHMAAQRYIANTAGVDVFALSTFKIPEYMAAQNAIPTDASQKKFFFMYEIFGSDFGLPFEGGFNFRDQRVRNKFKADMLTLALYFNDPKYYTINKNGKKFSPVFIWVTEPIRDYEYFVSTVQEITNYIERQTGGRLALIAGESVINPDFSEENISKMNAFYATSCYGYPDLELAAKSGGFLDDNYGNVIINNGQEWINRGKQITTIHGTPLEFWAPIQFGHGWAPENYTMFSSTKENADHYLDKLIRHLINPNGLTHAIVTSLNEHLEVHGVEPTRGALRITNGQSVYENLCAGGYNHCFGWSGAILRAFGPTMIYKRTRA